MSNQDEEHEDEDNSWKERLRTGGMFFAEYGGDKDEAQMFDDMMRAP